MRFKSFLKEETISSIDDITKRINEDCQQFLKESRNQPMYRGFGNRKKLGPMGGHFLPHPEDRPPLDSDAGFNFMFNVGADAAFGVRDIRKQSLFCVGSTTVAKNYGAVNFVFPTGDIDYIWSNRISDSYENRGLLVGEILTNLNSLEAKEFGDIMDFLAERMESHNFADNADASDVEFFIKSVMKDSDTSIPQQEELIDAIQKAFGYFYTNNSSLDRAIKSNSEILIYKSNGYYMIPFTSAVHQLGAEAASGDLIYKKLLAKIRNEI